MSTLYELTHDFKTVLEMAQDPDIDEQAIKDTLEMIGGDIEIKADGYAKVIRELTADVDTLTAEINRLTARKSAIVKKVDTMKSMLTFAMQSTGKTKFKTDLFSFNVQKNPPSLVVDDAEKIPAQFLIAQEPKVDKKAIADMIKSGAECDFAHLEQTEGVRIR
jgi:chaperonin cofactor prefoldin